MTPAIAGLLRAIGLNPLPLKGGAREARLHAVRPRPDGVGVHLKSACCIPGRTPAASG
jgi:hypothetical protein